MPLITAAVPVTAATPYSRILVLGHFDYRNPVDQSLDILCAVLAIAVIRRVTSGQPAGPLPYFNMT